MTGLREKRNAVDLAALQAHLLGLGRQPVLDAADDGLPDQLRALLATFPERRVQAGSSSGTPQLDAAHTTLTQTLTCAVQSWPTTAAGTLAVETLTMTVLADGTVTLALGGGFHDVPVAATVTGDETVLVAAVRSVSAGAFEIGTLIGQLTGAGDLWDGARSGLDELGLSVGQVTGFDYRLGPAAATPVTYAVTATAVTAALQFHSLTLDIGLWLTEKYLTGSLHQATARDSIDVTELLTALGLPVTDVPTGLRVRELSFTGGFGDIYELTVAFEDDWAIGDFALEQLSMRLAYTPGEKFVARFYGTITIDKDIAIEVSAARSAGSTGGWVFEGGLAAGDELTMRSLITALGLSGVPDPVAGLELTRLWLSYTTGTSQFLFTCVGDIDIAEDVTAVLGVTIRHGGADTRYEGTLRVGDFELDLIFDTGGTGSVIGAYRGPGSGAAAQVEVREWVAEFSADLAAIVPEGLRLDLLDAKVIRVKSGSGPAGLAVGFDISADLDLSQLPLVGGFLSQVGDLGIDALQVLYSTVAIDAATATAIGALLTAAGVLPVPSGGLRSGLAVTAELRLGSQVVPVALGLPAAANGPQSTGLAAAAKPASNAAALASDAPASSAATSSATGVWIPVQKQLGILQVERIGIVYQHNSLLFALDAAITLGPLKLSFDGLAVGSPLERFAPTFSLSGLGVAFTNPSVTVTGGLLHVPDPPAGVDFQYDGAAIVETQKASLAAVGSYAQLSGGAPSLFVFAQLDIPIGEPPLVISALMAGFGFNRTLTIPTAAQVPGFPLLALDAPNQNAMHVLDVLEGRAPTPDGTTRQWIAPDPGRYWLAFGAQLTVSEVVTATAVLVAEFGQEPVFALLGTAILQLPLKEEAAVKYVYAELGLEATLRPVEGIAQLHAQLSPASYVLTKDCHLTGGFAAAFWFGSNPHAGQFVVTLGGYHPAFRAPSYYPSVPRLGINWAVSGTVSITAGAYLAVTPSCAMAGADLRVLFHSGAVRAWFTAYADLLVSWRPFFFRAGIGVSIGASVRIDALFVHTTLSVSVGARLRLWGPPTGGTVTADLVVTSVTIGFGDDGRGAPSAPLTWSQVAAMLPARDKTLTVTAVAGLDSTMPDGEHGGNAKRWLVRARDMRFTTAATVPASHLRIGDTPLTPACSGDTGGIDIRPMNRRGVIGIHRLSLEKGGTAVDTGGWTITPVTHNLPASLWGSPPNPFSHTPSAPSADTVDDQPVGYAVQAPRPVLAPSRGVFPLSEYDAEEIPPGLSPLRSDPVRDSDYHCTPDPDAMRCLAAIGSVRSQRDQLYSVLSDAGLYHGGNDAMTALGAAADHLYSQAPMIETTGSPI